MKTSEELVQDILFEDYVKKEMGDIIVKDNGNYTDPKILNYRKIWDEATKVTNAIYVMKAKKVIK